MTATLPIVRMSAANFQQALGDALAEYMAAADLLGRVHVLQGLKARTGEQPRMSTMTYVFADDMTQVLELKSVPATGAIERIRNLTSYTRQAFDALKAKYRMQAFTVAGYSDVGLIERIQKLLGSVLEKGGTVEDFKTAVDGLTSSAGVSDLAQRHLDTVFQTNIQRAYQDGRFQQMRDPAVETALPFWKYSTAGDSRVRPAHAALEGFVAKGDDPVWRKIYPPSGYNCRCTVYAIGTEEAPKDAALPGLERLPALAATGVPEPGFSNGGVQ